MSRCRHWLYVRRQSLQRRSIGGSPFSRGIIALPVVQDMNQPVGGHASRGRCACSYSTTDSFEMTVSGKPCSDAVISVTEKSDAQATCDISRNNGSGSNCSAARKILNNNRPPGASDSLHVVVECCGRTGHFYLAALRCVRVEIPQHGLPQLCRIDHQWPTSRCGCA